MRKCMDIPSVLFSFSEAALKRRRKETEAEIKYVMSAQLKMCMAVHDGSRMMVEKMNDWETHVQLWVHSNARVGLQRITSF